MSTILGGIDRNLLNPKFQQYRLDTQVLQWKAIPILGDLPLLPTSARFQELSQFSSNNGLIPSIQEDSVFYITAQGEIVQVADVLTTTPRSVIIGQIHIEENSLPTLLHLENVLLACDGRGKILALESHQNSWTAYTEIELATLLPTDHISSTILMDAISTQNDTKSILISICQCYYGTGEDISKSTKFLVHALELRRNDLTTRLVFTSEGPHRPLHSLFTPDNSLLVFSESLFNSTKVNEMKSNVDVERMEQDSSSADEPRYMWTQNEQDLAIHIKLQGKTDKNQVQCLFQPQALRVKVGQELIFNQKTFDFLVPADSFWTLEDNQSCLSLYVTKKNEGTRWPYVWISDDGVLETLDPVVVDAYTSSLSKYHDQPESSIYQQALSEKSEMIDFEKQSATIAQFSLKDGSRINTVLAGSQDWIGLSLTNSVQRPFCLSYDVDAIVYDVSSVTENTLYLLSPQFVIPAASFVQASKRDKRFAGFTSKYFIVTESKHAFLYKRPESLDAESSEQNLISLDELGLIRGVCALGDSDLVFLGSRSLKHVSLSK